MILYTEWEKNASCRAKIWKKHNSTTDNGEERFNSRWEEAAREGSVYRWNVKRCKFCRKNWCTAREDRANYSTFVEMLTGRLREANLKLAWGINELVVKPVSGEECMDVIWSDIMGNTAIGKMVSPWI